MNIPVSGFSARPAGALVTFLMRPDIKNSAHGARAWPGMHNVYATGDAIVLPVFKDERQAH